MSCFFFNDTATTEIYTLSLHDALPIWPVAPSKALILKPVRVLTGASTVFAGVISGADRKSTRLNSSHSQISYAVFCLQKQTGAAAIRTARALGVGQGGRPTSAPHDSHP